MKRKLFTLLLAIGVLTAFQTNTQAQMKVRILADSSGLAKTSLKDDSFPRIKKGLYNWLSFSEKLSLKTSSDTLRNEVQKNLSKDVASVFTVKFIGSDSTKFSITPKDETNAVELKHKLGSTSAFNILKLNSTPDGNVRNGVLAKIPKDWTNDNSAGDTIAGYLAYVPNPEKTGGLKLDTLDVSVALVGADRNGTLSLKYFNEFAIYGDTLPYMLQSFQCGDDTPNRKFDPGKLYQAANLPYFQIYDGQDKPLLKSSKNYKDSKFDGGEATNWGHMLPEYRANPNDTAVYSWLDIKVVGDSAVILSGYKKDGSADSSATVRLDSLLSWVDTIRTNHSYGSADKKVGIDTTSLHGDSIPKWAKAGESGDSSHVYVKNVDGRLSFTVKLRNDKKESDWTNGYPTPFEYKGNKKDAKAETRYYRVDTAFHTVLYHVFVELFGQRSADSIFLPDKWKQARYLYKKDDNWRPLYVKVQKVNEDVEREKKYEYVGKKWLEDNKLFDVAIKPEILIPDLPRKYLSSAEGTVEFKDNSGEGAVIRILHADTIRKEGKGNWFANEKYDYPNNKDKKFRNKDSVELFYISLENRKFLTVSDTWTPNPNGEAQRNALEWIDSIQNDGLIARQKFAIVRNYLDSTFTFLPVAARNWVKKDDPSDTLTFNLAIGKDNEGGVFVNLQGAWRLESTYGNKLVVADSLSKTEPLRFKLESPLVPWSKPAHEYVAVKKKLTGRYYRGYSDPATYISNGVKPNDIEAQWRVEPSGENDWKFTPAVTREEDKKSKFAKAGKFRAYIDRDKKDDSTVFLEWSDGSGKDTVLKDTVLIERGYGPEDFDLYDGFAKDFSWKRDKGLVTVESSEKYLSYDDNNEVSYPSAEDSRVITIHKGDEDSALISPDYKIPYYRFSYRNDKDREDYFLKQDGDKIKWEKASNPEENAAYRFYLPAAHNGKFYLHSHRGHLVQVSKDGSKLSLDEKDKDIYSTLNAINDATDDPATLEWTITKKGDIEDEWTVVNPELFEDDSTAVGVLVIDGAGETFIGLGEGGKGVLSGRKDGSVLLKLKAVTLPASQSIVAYSPLKATAESEERAEYHIIHSDSLYLTDKADGVAFEKSESPKKFSFRNEETGDGFTVVLSDKDERHLSSKGLNLVFSETDDDRLSFKWGTKDEYGIITGIKVINATSAKAYGVSGGVKVANASGAVSIYTVDGRLVTTQAVTSPNQTIAVPAGIYIVRNGAEVTKVVVK